MEEESHQETPSFTVKKKVDDSWKDVVQKEKSTAAPEPPPASPLPEKLGFLDFISGLGMQTLAALGEIPDESGVTKPIHLEQAQYLIDVIEMLAQKSKGNLSPEEKTSLDELLYGLKVKFVQKSRAI